MQIFLVLFSINTLGFRKLSVIISTVSARLSMVMKLKLLNKHGQVKLSSKEKNYWLRLDKGSKQNKKTIKLYTLIVL